MARKTRRRSRNGDALRGFALGILGISLLSLLIGGAMWLKASRPDVDAVTNCPKSGPTAVHVVMIDQSDPISGQQAQEVRNHLTGVFQQARFGTRIDIYTLEGNSSDVLKPKTSLCAPMKPEDASEWTSNLEQLRRHFEERYRLVVLATIDGLLQAKTLPSSPIMESIRAASITSFSSSSLPPERLDVTLVSDMIQNTPLFSQISANISFPVLSKSNAWPSLRPRLKGSSVRILYVLRPRATRAGKPIQDRGHQMFWEDYVRASDGRLLSVDPI